MSNEALWAVIGTLATIIIAMVGGIIAVRNEIAKRAEQKWQRAIDYAHVFADEKTPLLVKKVARLALYDIGIEIREFEARAAKNKIARLDAVIDAFDVPPSDEQAERLKAAIDDLPPAEVEKARQIDPDLQALLGAAAFFRNHVMGLEAAFARARWEGRPEDDTRIRIAFLALTFAAAFLSLMIVAIRRVFIG